MFPLITHIDEVLPHIEGRTDFAVKRGDGYTSIDYIFAGSDTFDHPIRRECRGLKFCADTGEVIARPYHKFFNVDEKPETQLSIIDWTESHVVLDKLDGSMVHPAIVRGHLLWMTRAGVTEISEAAGRFANKNQPLVDWCWRMLSTGHTPIFEWCSPSNQIVVRYPTDKLVLTGLRRNYTGEYRWFGVNSTLPGGFPTHDIVDTFGEARNVSAFMAHAKGLEGAEGFVVRFFSGFHVKVKADAYVLRHKARDSVTLEKNVLRMVLEGAVDDVLPLLPESERDRLINFSERVNAAIAQAAEQLTAAVDAAKEDVAGKRKDFATQYVAHWHELLRGPAFCVFQGQDAATVLRTLALKHCGSATDVETIRQILLGGERW